MALSKRGSPASVGALTDVDSSQRNPLGLIVPGYDVNGFEAAFIYLGGVASVAAGDCVTYDHLGAVLRTDSDVAASLLGGIAIALAATVAAKFGWYQIGGLAVVKVSAAFAAAKPVWATSTVGEIDDAIVAGNQIMNAISRSAIDTPAVGFAYEQFFAPPWIGLSVV